MAEKSRVHSPESGVTKCPGIVLRRWAKPERAAVATLKVHLTAEAEIVSFEWEAVVGQETATAICAFNAAIQSVEGA